MQKALMVFLSAVLVSTVASRGFADRMIGELAPDFTAQDTHGESHSLSDYKGKFVILEWFNHDCPFVRKHYNSGNMQKLQRKYTQKGVVWLSINSSAPGKQGHYPQSEASRLTQEKGATPTAVLLDSDGTVGRLYGAKTTPHIFIIDPSGVLVYQGAVDDTPTTEVADIPKAVNYVELALEAALAGKPVEISSTKSYGCSVKYSELN
jgi:peroxiredoxin